MNEKSKSAIYTSKEFYLEDLPRTLFPLNTNKVLVENGYGELLKFSKDILLGTGSFLPQQRVYAAKDALHLRRTMKLDPVAEIFFYDLIFKNRTLFRKAHNPDRSHFGYRFENGRPISASKSYADFNAQKFDHIFHTEEFIGFDVASYFNGVYHHDLSAWFAEAGASSDDVEAFGKFLREINAGRSLDCLPQGIYPAKMIGNDFIRFIEDSSAIQSRRIARFMDDIYFFDDDMSLLRSDFAEAQRLLGLKGLSVNAAKTSYAGNPSSGELNDGIDALKTRLLKRRRRLIVSHYDDEPDIWFDNEDEADEDGNNIINLDGDDNSIGDDELDYIKNMLSSDNLSEEDAELIMVVMHDNIDKIIQHIGVFARGFPHLAKNFHGLCAEVKDKDKVAQVVYEVASNDSYVGEYQLFWFGVMLEKYLLDTKLAPKIISKLYKHQNATDISRAKILEIPDMRYGLSEMREAFLRQGRSDWLSWASAVGSRAMKKSGRNYLLSYFKNGSEMNSLVADIVQKD